MFTLVAALGLLGPSSVRTLRSGPVVATATLPAQRYVATNRFRVRSGREAAFEKRWADRKSRLGMLNGFRYFCMMRRCGGVATDDVNYVSCTVWEDFDNFDAWKKGDAFKDAHGGGTVGGVASMLLATAMNTKGKPKPAMWEAVLPTSVPPTAVAEAVGWRDVAADGETMLPADAFVAMNRFSVKEGFEGAFEQRFAARESTLQSFNGFRAFLLLRRDGKCDDGFNYSTWSLWKDQAAFESWKGSEERAGKPKPNTAPAASGGGGPPARPDIFERPPVPSFYEGILCLESALGA